MAKKTLYLGGGCFWCTEAVFNSLQGVEEVIPGYMGGTVENPSYEAVSTGTTGHAEVVKIMYNEELISTNDILDIFFATHDPTTINRQGNDLGTQYRSVIFYTDQVMREQALQAIHRALKKLEEGKRIVTEVVEVGDFYKAEDYHNSYYAKHRDAPYCQLVIDPKVEKFQKQFSDKIKST